MTARAAPGTRTLAAAVLRGAAAGEPRAEAGLRILDGPGAGRLLPLAGEETLGRGPRATLLLPDPAASRRHLRLRPTNVGVRAEDLGSKNGWTLNGRRPGRGALLRAGDVLGVGGTRLALETRDPPAAPAPPARPAVPPRLATPLLLALAAAAAALALLGPWS